MPCLGCSRTYAGHDGRARLRGDLEDRVGVAPTFYLARINYTSRPGRAVLTMPGRGRVLN
jgi:hypothetical protein